MKKSLLASAVLAVGLLATSSAFASETQNSLNKTAMQQEFSAFEGVETSDVSKAKLDKASGEFVWIYYAAVYGVPASYAIARWATSPSGSATIARVIGRW